MLEHREIGGFGGDFIVGDGCGSRASTGLGGGQLGLLRGYLVENLLLVELRQHLAGVDRLVDVRIELGDNAAGLGFHLNFGDGLNLARSHDRACDVPILGGA